jgi:hypothetical protein
MTYAEFQERAKANKHEAPIKSRRGEIHHFSGEKNSHPTGKSMKELINRKSITLSALRNSKKKQVVEMSELDSKT